MKLIVSIALSLVFAQSASADSFATLLGTLNLQSPLTVSTKDEGTQTIATGAYQLDLKVEVGDSKPDLVFTLNNTAGRKSFRLRNKKRPVETEGGYFTFTADSLKQNFSISGREQSQSVRTSDLIKGTFACAYEVSWPGSCYGNTMDSYYCEPSTIGTVAGKQYLEYYNTRVTYSIQANLLAANANATIGSLSVGQAYDSKEYIIRTECR